MCRKEEKIIKKYFPIEIFFLILLTHSAKIFADAIVYNTKLTFMKHFTKFALLLMLGMGLAHTAMAQIVGGGLKTLRVSQL